MDETPASSTASHCRPPRGAACDQAASAGSTKHQTEETDKASFHGSVFKPAEQRVSPPSN